MNYFPNKKREPVLNNIQVRCILDSRQAKMSTKDELIWHMKRILLVVGFCQHITEPQIKAQ